MLSDHLKHHWTVYYEFPIELCIQKGQFSTRLQEYFDAFRFLLKISCFSSKNWDNYQIGTIITVILLKI